MKRIDILTLTLSTLFGLAVIVIFQIHNPVLAFINGFSNYFAFRFYIDALFPAQERKDK